MLPIAKKIVLLPRYSLLWLIKIYQRTVSPDHGVFSKKTFPFGYCPYYPTCSEYGYQVIQKHGLIKGLAKTVWRILRCNPWTKGGVDIP